MIEVFAKGGWGARNGNRTWRSLNRGQVTLGFYIAFWNSHSNFGCAKWVHTPLIISHSFFTNQIHKAPFGIRTTFHMALGVQNFRMPCETFAGCAKCFDSQVFRFAKKFLRFSPTVLKSTCN